MKGEGDVIRGEFERFVAECADSLLRTAYLLMWDLPAAEDLVQECLAKVARRWPRVRTMVHPAAYARRILVNSSLDGAKRRARQRAELDQGAQLRLERLDVGAATEMASIEQRFALARAIGTLPPRQRAALVLRYFEDLTEAQTAEVLGCSVGTVKSSTSRALDHLRAELTPSPDAATPDDVVLPLVTQSDQRPRSASA